LFAASALEAGVRRAWRDEQAGILVEHEGDSRAAVSRVLGSHEDAAEVRVTFFRSMREFLRDPWVLRVLSGILVLVLLASAYFGMAMGLSPVDALYFVVSTVTTTGYGDISPRSFGVGAEVAAMFVMLGGTTLSAVLFALISDRLFTLRIDTALGHWPIPRRNHVVVVGVGDVGVRVCEAFLDLDTPIVAIEKDSNGRFVAQMRGRRVPLVLADATVSSTLEFAQVKHARAVVCVTDHDLVNVEVALNARRLNPAVRTVVRIQEPDFAARLGNRLGVDVALSSARIAAPVFVRSALERGNG
jgi:voltage-gated potassium channel Kch